MTITARQFFDELGRFLDGSQFRLTKPSDTGRNLYGKDSRGIEITSNYVVNERENRLSVKLTINRGTSGGATPLYDALAERHKVDSLQTLGPGRKWSPAATKTESKIEIERNLAQFHENTDAMCQWVLEKAIVYKSWVDEAE